ncbi:hypothetical protein KEM60_02294 [Austwickia sp. TVS 96-490-7B]|uniref:hypothetical protein n=1 Tax=Austwickia sp. TVS 96-490-7B TaxID=2830843 RepID=UPI001C59113C|nr:hypothetical protein [Austwickia sp. TVS 96-490-7B]MBW3086083.1 hypothetical protein [Austwickia sp. TVS 96-490-7B]
MSILDTVRLHAAVIRYDFALDLRGVPGRARRDLRRELRSNLRSSATQSGINHALAGIGSPESLARESAAALRDPRRPAWTRGLVWVGFALTAYWIIGIITMFTWMDAIVASGVTHEVVGGVTMLPGIEYRAQHTTTSVSLGLTLSAPTMLVSLGIFTLTFALGARLWRPLRRVDA